MTGLVGFAIPVCAARRNRAAGFGGLGVSRDLAGGKLWLKNQAVAKK
jgi:hypothetical protein